MPQDDPVLLVGGRSFLGGRFAVPVEGMPAEAGVLGRSGDTEVLVVPGHPPRLYVRTGSVIDRWLTVHRARGPGSPTAFFVGDSIMVGSRQAVEAALRGWTTEFDAQVGRTSLEGIDAVGKHPPGEVEVTVVELGTNDSDPGAFADRVGTMLDLVGDSPLVVWVTVHLDVDFLDELNAAIRAGAGRLPNAAIADWAAAVDPERDLVEDGIHPNEHGRKVLASLLSDLLTRGHRVASGESAPGCG